MTRKPLLLLLVVPAAALAAFPQVDSVGTYTGNAATSHSANYPAVVDSGELLIEFGGNDGTGDTCTITGPTILLNPAVNSQNHGASAYYETADGDEDGTTFTVSCPTEELTYYSLAISGWDGTTAPEISSGANGSSTAPNPDSITPSWGSEDNLYIAFITWNGDAGTVGYPAAYTDNRNADQVGTVSGAAFATVESTTSPQDPAAFSTSNSVGWQAYTIAVRPAGGGSSTVAITLTQKRRRTQ